MKFLDYIKGQRKGKEAHRIEKKSMRDPFLYEAIEGFDSIDDDHFQRITDLQKRINAKHTSFRRHIWQSVAASIIIIFGIGGYLFVDYQRSALYAQEPQNAIIDVYVPEVFYVENIVPIAQKNAEIAKTFKPQIARFKIDESIELSLSKEDEEELKAKEKVNNTQSVIDVYIPDNYNKE